MLSVKTKSVRWKAKQIFRLGASCAACARAVVTLASACGSEAATARRQSASGRWCSRRRPASGTTRSPTACAAIRRLGREPRALTVDTTGDAARFTHAAPGALRRRDLPLDDRHADRQRARSSGRSSATSAPAAATSACTPPRTRAGTGRGTSGLVGARFKRHDPGDSARDRARRGPRHGGDARPARRLGAHRRVVRVPLATRARACTCSWRATRRTMRVRSPGATATMAAARCTPRWVIRRRPSPSRAFLAPPARRDRDGRRPREVRLCALSDCSRVAASRSCSPRAAASDPEPPAPRRSRRPRRRPRRARRRRGPTREPPPAPAATARAPRSTRSRSTPATARSWSAPARRCSASRPARRRRERVTGQLSTPQGEGTVSGNLVVRFAGPGDLLASGHPQEGDLPENLGLIRSQRPRRHVGVVAGLGEADYHELEVVGDLIVAVNVESPDIQVSRDGGRRGRRARRRRRRSTSSSTPATPSTGRSRPSRARSSPPTAASPGARATRRSARGWSGRRRTRSTASTATARCASARTAGAAGRTAARSAGCRAKSPAGRKDELLAAVVGGKVRRSRDGGKTWSTVSHFALTDARWLAHPTNAPRRFAGQCRKSRLTSALKIR